MEDNAEDLNTHTAFSWFMVDFGKSFKLVFEDYTTLMIGTLLYFIPIVNFVVIGHLVGTMRNAMKKKKLELAPFQDWGNLFSDGLRYLVASILYMIPTAIAVAAGVIASIIAFSMFPNTLPWLFVAPLSLGLGILLLATLAILPSAIMEFIEQDSVFAVFNYNAIMDRANNMHYFKTVGITYCIGLVISMPLMAILTTFTPGVIADYLPTALGFWLGTFSLSVWGQLYKECKWN